jgi:hypothetical protein
MTPTKEKGAPPSAPREWNHVSHQTKQIRPAVSTPETSLADQRAVIAVSVIKIESKLAVKEKLTRARAIKSGSMPDTVSDIDKSKKDTRAAVGGGAP